jgi:hypothetical protein
MQRELFGGDGNATIVTSRRRISSPKSSAQWISEGSLVETWNEKVSATSAPEHAPSMARWTGNYTHHNAYGKQHGAFDSKGKSTVAS